MTCSPEQIRILTKFVRSHDQRVAAAKAGMSLSTAKRYLRMNGEPKEKTHKPRSWRTRSDPFAGVWPEIQELLERDAGLDDHCQLKKNPGTITFDPNLG